MRDDSQATTEIIAIASGKGGTGKSLIAGSLGYALKRAGHDVLMIDADPGTDGLSLFLLGPEGIKQFKSFKKESAFSEILKSYSGSGPVQFVPHSIDRITLSPDHGVRYKALISSRGMYGHLKIDDQTLIVPRLPRDEFRTVIRQLFDDLREQNNFNYVIVDTRGGFAFESTDVCALADRFIVVTEADYTSLHQDRNLVRHITAVAAKEKRKTLLGGVIVNKAVDGDEEAFRSAISDELGISFDDTYAVPLEIAVVKSYKTQQMPYVVAPASHFCYSTLRAFSNILRVVTAQWPTEKVEGWKQLVDEVAEAIDDAHAAVDRKKEEEAKREREALERDRELDASRREVEDLSERTESLKRELQQSQHVLENEKKRADEFRGLTSKSPAGSPAEPPRAFHRLTRWSALAAIVLASVFSIVYYQYFGPGAFDSRLVGVYATNRPPALRVRDLLWLYRRGHRSFDGLVFENLDAAGVDLSSASFARANLRGADLRGANLSGANLGAADLTGARLVGASLLGADLAGAVFLDAHLQDILLNAEQIEALEPGWGTIPLLVEALNDQDTEVREAAVLALAHLDPRDDRVLRLLSELALHSRRLIAYVELPESERLYVAAAKVLAYSGAESTSVIEALHHGLRRRALAGRADTIWALGRIGAAARNTVPDLVDALTDDSVEVQAAAAWALEQIGAPNLCLGVDCDDADACTIDSCDPATGECSNDPSEPCPAGQECDPDTGKCADIAACTDDADCDDEDACTTDTCTDGVCANEAVDCDDGDACTDDTCDPATGDCSNDPVVCEDPTVCVDGECVDLCLDEAGDPKDCDDGDACTLNTCVAATGDCVAVPISCEEGEACVDGECVPDLCVDVDCDDANGCTTDSCDPATGDCSNDPCRNPTPVCNEATNSCEACVSNADCADGFLCTNDTCNGGTGACTNTAVDVNCPDPLFCDGADTCEPADPDADADGCLPSFVSPCSQCNGGTRDAENCAVDADCDVCVGGQRAGETCTVDAECNVCNGGLNDGTECTVDGDCTGGGVCDLTGACDNGRPCDLGPQACDEATDACFDCVANADCDDGIDCTNDFCDGGTGYCTHTDDCKVGACNMISGKCE